MTLHCSLHDLKWFLDSRVSKNPRYRFKWILTLNSLPTWSLILYCNVFIVCHILRYMMMYIGSVTFLVSRSESFMCLTTNISWSFNYLRKLLGTFTWCVLLHTLQLLAILMTPKVLISRKIGSLTGIPSNSYIVQTYHMSCAPLLQLLSQPQLLIKSLISVLHSWILQVHY